MTETALYIVATPIGNLSDMVPRGIEVLQTVSVIAAEDARHSARLLQHFGISTPVLKYHDHSNQVQVEKILQRLADGESVALISDAGTPLISDPGYRLVFEARRKGIKVIPIPGACALITALSAAGLPTDRFIFEGFLPAKQGARQRQLEKCQDETRTLVFYEAPHRIEESLHDMADIFGDDREATVARELTKTFETILSGSLAELKKIVSEEPNQRKGEFVVLVAGAVEKQTGATINPEAERILDILLEELSVKQSSSLAAKITGLKKKPLYQAALEKKERPSK